MAVALVARMALVLVALLACSVAAERPQRQLLYDQKVAGGSNDPIYLGYDNTDSYKQNRTTDVAVLWPGVIVAIILFCCCCVKSLLDFLGSTQGRARFNRDPFCGSRCLHALCCTSPPNPNGYSKWKRILMLVWVIICWCLLIICASVHAFGLAKLESGTNTMMSNLQTECQMMVGKTNKLIKTMEDLHEPDIRRTEMRNVTTNVCTQVQATTEDLQAGYDTLRAVTIAYWVIMCIAPILAVVSWALGRGSLAYAMIPVCWTLMIITFIHFGIAYSGASWLDDTCMQMQNWYDCRSPAKVYDKAKGIPVDAVCTPAQLTLASSGALSQGHDLCPDFEHPKYATAAYSSGASGTTRRAAFSSGYSSGTTPEPEEDNFGYWDTVYEEQWDKLNYTVYAYNLFWDGPAFGIEFLQPGSTKPPIRCGDPTPGASCVSKLQAKAYPNVTALRKLYYDSEGGHYDSDVKSCTTLWNMSTATLGTTDEHDWSHYDVKDPSTYDNSCVDAGWCNLTALGLKGLFAQPLIHTNHTSGKGSEPALTQKCHEKAILTTADAMWKASYMDSCAYLWDAAGITISNDGACDTVGDGFIFYFGTIGFAGILYFVILLVMYIAMHAWEKRNYAENLENKMKDVTQDPSTGFEGADPCGKEPGIELEHIEVSDVQLEEKKDFEDVT